MIWLVDAALQFQPYMFTKAFVSNVIKTGAAGNPAVIARPILWSAGLMFQHIIVYNALFATTQLLIAFGVFWRPTVKATLAVSIAWCLGVWWIGEGMGGVLNGTANPFTGAPGAVILYAFLALLAWPCQRTQGGRTSLASSSLLGSAVPRLAWLGLWGSLAYFAVLPANRSPGRLEAILFATRTGEPGWVSAMDGIIGHALAHQGTKVALAMAALSALAATSVAIGALSRAGVVIAGFLGAIVWLAENFGGVFTGQGTDPNSGLLLIVLAIAFWPFAWREKPAGLAGPASPDVGGRGPDTASKTTQSGNESKPKAWDARREVCISRSGCHPKLKRSRAIISTRFWTGAPR